MPDLQIFESTIENYRGLDLEKIDSIVIQRKEFLTEKSADIFLRLSSIYMRKGNVGPDETGMIGYAETSNYEDAKIAAYIAYSLSQILNLDEINVEAAYQLGLVYTNIGDYDNAELWTNKALEIYKKDEIYDYVLDAYLTIIWCNFNKSDLDTTRLSVIFNDAFGISKKCEGCVQNEKLLNNYAHYQKSYLQNYEKAKEIYISLLDYYRIDNSQFAKINYFWTLLILADIELEHYDTEKREYILDLLKKAVDEVDQLSLDLISINLNETISDFYHEDQQKDEAFAAIMRVKELYEKGDWKIDREWLKNKYSMAFNIVNIC